MFHSQLLLAKKAEGEEKRPGPKWVVNDEDEELWGAALGHGAGRDVLKSRSATAGFVKSKCKPTDEGMSTELAEERSSLQKRKASDISVPLDSSSSSFDELSAVKLEISAVKYCLGLSIVIPETKEENFVKMYQRFDEVHLSKQLDYLQAKELELEKHRQAMELEYEKQKTTRMSSNSSSGKLDSTLL